MHKSQFQKSETNNWFCDPGSQVKAQISKYKASKTDRPQKEP